MTTIEYDDVVAIFDKLKVQDEQGMEYLAPSLILSGLQMLGLNPSFADVSDAVALADTNQDGKIELSEFESFVSQMENTIIDPEVLRLCFLKFDINGDGTLSYDEFRVALQQNGEGLTDEEMERAIDLADVNKDGVIDWQEFIDYMAPGGQMQYKPRIPVSDESAQKHKDKAGKKSASPSRGSNRGSPGRDGKKGDKLEKSESQLMFGVMIQGVEDAETQKRDVDFVAKEQKDRENIMKKFNKGLDAKQKKIQAQKEEERIKREKEEQEAAEARAAEEEKKKKAEAEEAAKAKKVAKPVKEKRCC